MDAIPCAPWHDSLSRKKLGIGTLHKKLTTRASNVVFEQNGVLEPKWLKCAYGTNVQNHRADLQVAQSLNQAFGTGVDFQNVPDEKFRGPSKGECGHLVQSWCPCWAYLTTCISRNSSQSSENQFKMLVQIEPNNMVH